jgi:hypothetical protein
MAAADRRIVAVEVGYTLDNGTLVKASLGGAWEQWNAKASELRVTLPLTERLSAIVNEVITAQ